MIVLFILFIIFSFSLLCYYFCIFRRFLTYKDTQKTGINEPVSVVICAKNEEENLKAFLPAVYAQNYPDFEVVLIDDRSTDDTFDVIRFFKEKYPQKTKIVRVNSSDDNRLWGNKKYALTLGIKAASHDKLLFTDADCKPVGPQWIDQMSRQFSGNKQLILGYGKYQHVQNSCLNKLIRFETVQTALQYFSSALAGKPYMGVGRNLAYTKNLFMDNNGFYSHLDVLSGDDDLFVNEVATAKNTVICISPESFTVSKPKTTWADLIRQKRRHISTAGHYQLKHRLLLTWYFISLAGFWVTGIWLLVKAYLWPVVLGIIFVRLLIAWYINYKTNLKLKEKGLSLWFPLLEIGLISFQFVIFVLNLIKNPVRWTS